MGVQKGYSFCKAYESYLAWFRDKATDTAKPKDEEEILGCQLCNEDVFEGDGVLLNRVFFVVPLLPSESRNGRLEVFVITELNLMKKAEDSDEIVDVISVEYTAQPFQA